MQIVGDEVPLGMKWKTETLVTWHAGVTYSVTSVMHH